MHEIIHDPIDVVATFSNHRIRPLHMRWNNRNYALQQLNLVHTAREGLKKIFYFSVSDLSNSFKLRLDTDTLEWHLTEVYSG